MLGGTVTVKVDPLLTAPPTVTITLPVVAPAGTGTPMPVALQPVGVAAVPLKVTVLAPWLAPKFAPAIVTDPPTTPAAGVRLVMLGGTVTVKVDPLLTAPPTVTITLPVVAPAGTGIRVPVPAGATTGNVMVTVGGAVSNGSTFTVTVPPSIMNLTVVGTTPTQAV